MPLNPLRTLTSAAPLKLAVHPSSEYTASMNVTLKIPDEAVNAVAGTAGVSALKQTVATELAVVMYENGSLPVGKAMELAGMTRREFHELLKSRGARRPFDDVELSKELRH